MSQDSKSPTRWTPSQRHQPATRFTARRSGVVSGRLTGRSTGWQPSAHDLSGSSRAHPQAGDAQSSFDAERWRPRHLVAAAFLVAIAAAAAVIAMARGGLQTEVAAHRPVARVELAFGSVGDQAGDPLRPGDELAADRLLATGSDGGVALRLESGPSVRLAADSRARLTSESQLLLERGALYVDAGGRAQVEVRTSLGSIRDIGTQFEVRLVADDAGAEGAERLRIRVREGTVLLIPDLDSGSGGTTYTARVGEQLTLDATGNLLRGTSPIHGSHWDWVVRTAPLPDVEGESLRVFLDWLGREGGWNVRYADLRVQRIAGTTILHGELGDLTATEAASMVLRSSGLDYRIDDGVLEVLAGEAP